MAKVVEHKKAICVEFGDTNNNKFWQYTLYDDGTALTEWGRVGNTQASKTVSHEEALKKWREKTRDSNKPDKRYTEVKTVGETVTSGKIVSVANTTLKDIAKKQIKTTNPLVQQLIDFLVKVNAHNICQASGGSIQYDTSSATFKTPLGIIDPEQVDEARKILTDMADFVNARDFDSPEFGRQLNQYLRLIPHDVGRVKISPSLILPNLGAVQKENDLLDGLATSFIQVTAPKQKPDDKKKKADEPSVFQVDMEIVTDQKIISFVRNLYQSTRKAIHQSNNLSIDTIYAVTIKKEREAFARHGAVINNVRQLWHGTKASNLLSILKQGLIIPPASSAHCTGRMFGNGIYASDISTKALNYATSYWSGGGSTDRTFMFLADVAMGKEYISRSYGDFKTPRDGFDSTFARGGSGSGVQNNEMIVYRTDQVQLVYLVEFTPRKY